MPLYISEGYFMQISMDVHISPPCGKTQASTDSASVDNVFHWRSISTCTMHGGGLRKPQWIYWG